MQPITTADADAALARVLDAMAGPGTPPRDGQAEAVRALTVDRARVLVVEATGWGKSAVYWAATAANRGVGAGPTIVVSPLLALMRDQIAAGSRAGVSAVTINSTNIDDWDDTYARLRAGTVDVVLVSPERLASPSFTAALTTLSSQVGLVVIDEAHCISDWGHDFRPDYQRIASTLLHYDVPVLATTATANDRVTADVAGQLGPGTVVIRGSLARASLRLDVVPGLTYPQRWAWVADALDRLPGSGIVYALTVADAERLAEFLTSCGFDVAAYTGRHDTDVRAEVEARLQSNAVKAVIATSALGMGYDKPDLSFCIHVGSPASPVSMYQQVGRAGRALDDAVAVLLPAESDAAIWEYFATVGIPDPDVAARVLERLEDGSASVVELEAATGARRGRLEALLRVLAVDGAVTRDGSRWVATGTGWWFDAEKYAALRRVRAKEADLMRTYATEAGCLMMQLQVALDDPDPTPCGRCSVCTGKALVGSDTPDPDRVTAVLRWLRDENHVIEARKMWPPGVEGRRGRIVGAEDGRAVAFADDPGWPDVVAEVTAGRTGETTHSAAVEVLGRWRRSGWRRPTLVVALPGPAGGPVAATVAAHVASVGKLPLAKPLSWSGGGVPRDTASAVRVRALLERLHVVDPDLLAGATVLLVAASMRTGWTVAVASALLRDAGADAVLPLVMHQRP